MKTILNIDNWVARITAAQRLLEKTVDPQKREGIEKRIITFRKKMIDC